MIFYICTLLNTINNSQYIGILQDSFSGNELALRSSSLMNGINVPRIRKRQFASKKGLSMAL